MFEFLEPIVEKYATKIEKEADIDGLVNEVMMNKSSWILRYLHYFGGKDKPIMANPHIDKSGFTIHLYESDPGLGYYCMHTKIWKSIINSNEYLTIMNGAQIQLRTKNKFIAHCHRVLNDNTTVMKDRHVLVCFIPLERTPRYNKTKYGNMQSHEPGFNYHLSYKKFSKFFCFVKKFCNLIL